jgi:hypothetical protein
MRNEQDITVYESPADFHRYIPKSPEHFPEFPNHNSKFPDYFKIVFIMSDLQNGGQSPQQGQTIIVNQQPQKSNGVGTAGFVLALITVFFGWIPVLGWILWVLGLVLSFVGVFKQPKGLAIAGLVISLIGLILIIVVGGLILAAIGLS